MVLSIDLSNSERITTEKAPIRRFFLNSEDYS